MSKVARWPFVRKRRIMVYVSGVVSQRLLERALGASGAPLSADEFLTILGEVVSSTDTLTGAENDFLLRHGGVSSDAFDADRLAAARERIAAESQAADRDASRDGHTTTEVAQLTGMAAANVRRSLARGDLYSAGLQRGREHVFPAWQFRHGKPLPHLRRILTALPPDMHPLDVAAFMSTRQPTLSGRTVPEWLGDGGAAEPAVRLAEDLARL